MRERVGIDRRSGFDRRIAYDLEYFQCEGIERRSNSEKREFNERRIDWVRISPWSTIKHVPESHVKDWDLPHVFLHSILKQPRP